MREGAGLKICPFCKEQIREEAVKCRFCGEWLGEAITRTTVPESDAKATRSGGVDPELGAVGRAIVTNQETDGASTASTPATPAAEAGVAGKPPRQKVSWMDYWYGYLYMAFCGYLTYCAVTRFLFNALTPAPPGNLRTRVAYWLGLVAAAGLTVFFAYATYTLLWRRVRMGLIYAVVTLHG